MDFMQVQLLQNNMKKTQSSLLGASTTFRTEKFKITPRVYWKRGQDEYVYIRDNPSVYRNLHITNKVGVETNASYTSNIVLQVLVLIFLEFLLVVII